MSENRYFPIPDIINRVFDENKNSINVDLDGEEKIKLIDEVSSTITYVGSGKIGSLTSDSIWQIKKIEVSGTITSIKYADGVSSFTKVWDNRATYTYS